MDTGKSAIGLDGNLAAALGYPIGIIALILIFMEKENKFVRFHALQSVLYTVGVFVLAIVLWIVILILAAVLGMVSANLGMLIGGLGFLVYLVVLLIWLAGLIFAAIKAYGGN